MANECLIKDCGYPVRSRGLCPMHYHQWYAGNLEIELPEPISHSEAGKIGGSKKHPNKGFGSRKLTK
jgi:hypothetical protein